MHITKANVLWGKSKLLLIFLIFVTSAISLNAVWNWTQYPDPTGVDVELNMPNYLANDWMCNQTGLIRKICLYHSWKDDIIGQILAVNLQIWSDVPDPDGPGPLFSHPGVMLWQDMISPGQGILFGTGNQAWYDPWTHTYIPNNHNNYYRLPIVIPDAEAFTQTNGTVYWLAISVIVADPINTHIGWKTTYQPWGDQATYYVDPNWLIFGDTPPAIPDLAVKIGDDVNDECPVELSSFSGTFTTGLCQINWVTQSETEVQGFNIYRNTENQIGSAVKINGPMIGATNTSQTSVYHFQDTEIETDQTYYYWLESYDYSGSSDLFGPINIRTESGSTPIPVPLTTLSSVYPNPARTNPSVDVSVKDTETATLSIFNVKGQVVKTFTLQAGKHRIDWNRTDLNNHKCAEGVYFYRLTTPSSTLTKKVLILN